MKAIFFIVATLSLIIGVIAIFIPLIPTTPFLLLSSYLYIKSSKKAYNWLINSKYLGKYIRNYQEKKGIPLKIKIISILLLWLSIIFTSVFFVYKSFIKFILFLIALGVTIHIIKIKTYKEEK